VTTSDLRLRVFEKRVFLGECVDMREEVVEGWTKLRLEEFHNLYFSPNVIRMIKSRRVIWAGYVVRMGDDKFVQNVGWET
jgi:hypothetical protein